MKAVILENRDGYSAILREDGVIEKVKKQGEVGDTIIVNIEKRKRTAQIYRFAQVAAAAMFFLVAGGTARHFVFVPSSYVTMDVNPSVEFSMNRLDRVIDVSAVNEDAEEVVSSLKKGKVWGRSLEDLIGETTQLLEEYEYLDSTEDSILFAVATDSDEEYDKISACVLGAEGSNKGLTVEVIRGGKEDRDRAEELSLSVGRYLKMMESISGADTSTTDAGKNGKTEPDDLTVKEFRQMPVEEILGKTMSGTGTETQGPSGTKPDTAVGQNGTPMENQQGGNGQTAGQPGNQDAGRTAGQAGNQGAGQTPDQAGNREAGQAAGQSGNQEAGQAAGQSGNQEAGQAAGQSGNQEAGQAAGQSGNQEAGQAAGQIGNQEAGQTENRPDNQENVQPAGQEAAKPAAETEIQGAGQSAGQETGQVENKPGSQGNMQSAGQETDQPTVQRENQADARTEFHSGSENGDRMEAETGDGMGNPGENRSGNGMNFTDEGQAR